MTDRTLVARRIRKLLTLAGDRDAPEADSARALAAAWIAEHKITDAELHPPDSPIVGPVATDLAEMELAFRDAQEAGRFARPRKKKR